MISISDAGGNKYVVPLNSVTKFGLIYELGSKVFDTVEDILNADKLPRVVSVGASYVGNNENSSVARYEVLVVKGVDKTGIFRRKPQTLKVYSITKEKEKSLTKDVFGKFSTDPFK